MVLLEYCLNEGWTVTSKTKKSIIGILVLAVVLLAISQYVASHIMHNMRMRSEKPKSTIQTNGEVPGNPENGRKSLREFYLLRNKFISITGNQNPSVRDILSGISDDPRKFGLSSPNDLGKLLGNRDNIFSDNDMARKYPSAIFLREPNKFNCQGNERYVISSSDTYLHRNIKQVGDEKTTVNPVGFYQVLWSDGTIQEVPYDQVLYVPDGNKRFKEAFPGQCGLPNGTLSYDEYWTKIAHFKSAPRGKKGEKGIDFSGNRY